MKFYVNIKEKKSGVFVVSLLGHLDTNTAALLEKQIEPILKKSPRGVILNMEGVSYISSMGIGAVFKIKKTVKENRGTLLIINLQPQIKKVFETVKALPEEIFSSIEEADEYLNAIQQNFERNKSSPL